MTAFATQRPVVAGSLRRRPTASPATASSFTRHQMARAERLLATDPFVRLVRAPA